MVEVGQIFVQPLSLISSFRVVMVVMDELT